MASPSGEVPGGGLPAEVEVLEDSKPAAKRSRAAAGLTDSAKKPASKYCYAKQTEWMEHFHRLNEIAVSRNGKRGQHYGLCRFCEQA